jgi:sugar O-acyltransferase (sialic acid O-acetyltransferase NeuD family)
MPGLVLVGASGLAREALAVVRSTGTQRVLGILDDDAATWGTLLDGVAVLGGLEGIAGHPDAEVLLCVGAGAGRADLADRLGCLGVGEDRFATVVHPRVDVPPGCTIGRGSIVLAGVAVTADVRIGRHVVVMPHATITHDDVLEDFVTLAAGVCLGGGVRVRARAYLGMNASVRQRVSVGADAVLGMGAALLRDLPSGETWVGVPARRLDASHGGAGRGAGRP